jgi:hypothetical protein
MTADLNRLGKRGSYRLGRLRAQGVSDLAPPAPFRPRFVRPEHRGPTALWLLALVIGMLLIWAGAVVGWWFMPFGCGLLAGLFNRYGGWRIRTLVPAVALMAVAGWAIPLCFQALRGQPYWGTARVIAALVGLPASAALAIALTLLLGVLEALAGLWLGRALLPQPTDDHLLP